MNSAQCASFTAKTFTTIAIMHPKDNSWAYGTVHKILESSHKFMSNTNEARVWRRRLPRATDVALWTTAALAVVVAACLVRSALPRVYGAALCKPSHVAEATRVLGLSDTDHLTFMELKRVFRRMVRGGGGGTELVRVNPCVDSARHRTPHCATATWSSAVRVRVVCAGTFLPRIRLQRGPSSGNNSCL